MPTSIRFQLPLPDGAPSSIAHVIAAYRADCEVTRRPIGRGRPLTPIDKETERAVVSAARAGFRYATGLDGEDLDALDARVLMIDLPSSAAAAAEAAGHSKPSNAERLARQFVAAVLGSLPGRQCKNPKRFLPAPWRELLSYYEELGFQQSHLTTLARCAAHLRMHDAPSRVPDGAELREAMHSIGMKTSYASNVASNYRAARALYIERNPTDPERFGVLEWQPSGGARIGLLSIEQAAVVCPTLHAQVVEYLELGTRVKRKDGEPTRRASVAWRDQVSDTERHVVTALLALEPTLRAAGTDLPPLEELEAKSLIACNVDVTVGAKSWRKGGATTTKRVSVLRYVIDHLAPEYRARMRRPTKAGYTQGLHRLAQAVWSLVMYGEDYALDEELYGRWRAIDKSLRGALTGKGVVDKMVGMRNVSLPLIQCVLLPTYLRYWVEPAWEVYQHALKTARARGHRENHPAVTRAERWWDTVCERYLAVAVAMDDGLRNKQYAQGVHGRNVIPHLDKHGVLLRVETNWIGDRESPAGVKTDLTPRLEVKQRTRDVRRGFLDHRTLQRYLETTRKRRIAARGLVDDGSLALFISPKNARLEHDREVRTPGSYTTTSYGQALVGRGLHSLLRDVLQCDIPAWSEPALKSGEWMGITGGHFSRTLIATYWLGVVGDERVTDAMTGTEIACYLTTDEVSTLRAEYVSEIAWLKERTSGSLHDPMHPRAYNQWMFALYNHGEACPLDDPLLPVPESVRDLITRRESNKRRAARRGRIPGQLDIRLARPGQRVAA